MKKYLLILINLILYSSCQNYLDVRPSSEVDIDALFQTEEGIFESLIGVYSRCSEENLYGFQMTMGLPDVLSQNYSLSSNERQDYHRFRNVAIFNYNHQDFISKRDEVWAGLYNAISNCNLILEKLEEFKHVLREENDYNIIKGETMALRAYLHFDALRLFAPSYVQGPGTPAIPYVKNFSNQITPQTSVAETIELILTDLLQAKEILQESDPIYTDDYRVGYTFSNINSGLPIDGSNEQLWRIFLQNRRHRMNYYAVCGTLARVYLYKNDQLLALENAQEVIDSEKFPFTSHLDFIEDDEEKKDRILYKELLFAWYVPNLATSLRNIFENRSNAMSIFSSEGNVIYETGGVGAEDDRYKQWFLEDNDGITNRLYLQKYRRETDANLHYLVSPALRLSEMYYIAAECVFDADPELAWDYFNTVRYHRGIGSKIEGETSKDVFLTELIKESRKEFFAEGQIFYMYKRLHRNIVGQSSQVHGANNRIFVLPMPDDEIVFGQRN